MQKRVVFVSHITSEKDVAIAFKELIQASFLGMVDVFVSSDPSSNPLGQKWLDNITAGLKKCAIEIILASPRSVKRPWINFEAGAGYVRDIPVIPLCHSGMTPSDLPAPLDSLQAARASEEADLANVFPIIAKSIGSSVPQVDFSAFIATVRHFESTTNAIASMARTSPIAPTDGLNAHELATLVSIGEKMDAPGQLVSVYDVRQEMSSRGFRSLAVTLAIAALGRKGLTEQALLQDDWNRNEYAAVRITPEGLEWLDTNQHLLLLEEVAYVPITGPANDLSKLETGDDIPF